MTKQTKITEVFEEFVKRAKKNWELTILNALTLFLCVGAVLYSVDNIAANTTSIKSICFWSFLSIWLIGQMSKYLEKLFNVK